MPIPDLGTAILVFQGAASPEYFQRVIVPNPDDPSPPDYTQVTSVRFQLRNVSTDAVSYWPGSIVSASTSSMLVQHTFAADGSDVPLIVTYIAMVLLTINGVEIRQEPFPLGVMRG